MQDVLTRKNMYSDGHSIYCLKHNGFPSCPKLIFVQALEGLKQGQSQPLNMPFRRDQP